MLLSCLLFPGTEKAIKASAISLLWTTATEDLKGGGESQLKYQGCCKLYGETLVGKLLFLPGLLPWAAIEDIAACSFILNIKMLMGTAVLLY